MYDIYKHFRRVGYEKWSYYGYFLAVKPFLTVTFLDIAVSRDFAYFCILGAVRGKSKQTIVGIKVVYGTNKHKRSISSEKWGQYGYFVAVIPFLTATSQEIAVSRDFCVFLDFGGR